MQIERDTVEEEFARELFEDTVSELDFYLNADPERYHERLMQFEFESLLSRGRQHV